AQHLVEEFVGEIAFSGGIGGGPDFEHGGFHAPHGFPFGDAGIGDTVHVPFEQDLFVGGGEIPVVRHPLVEVVGDAVEDILFEVCTGAGDEVNLVLPDHLGERKAEFGRAHGSGQADHHAASGIEMGGVATGRIDQGGGVEVAVVMFDEPADRTGGRCLGHG